ncbi:helix-turn-helix domain-containing protein [Streptomyces sp. NPDC051771]|uniref:helix-turn-helix domain-containing protein n=1 Tax=Streptomyces sp. NPDC051771 TaxID=3154847 RepID=UPI00343F1021
MASTHPNARSHARGLVHRNVRLTTRYVVVSNELARHPDLTVAAIGLAVILQSLPAGASVGIKALAERTKGLSEMKIAAALRELEAAGFLARTRERLPDGRFVPRTISYNRPGADREAVRETKAAQEAREGQGAREAQEGPPAPKVPERRAAPPKPSSPPPLPVRHHASVTLLAGLRGREPRLLLSERDVRRLAPGVTEWLERGAHPEAVSRTLCADLPPDLAHPAGIVAYRLATLIPPPLPAGPVARPAPDPFQSCDDCDLAFRAPEPGLCVACQASAAA